MQARYAILLLLLQPLGAGCKGCKRDPSPTPPAPSASSAPTDAGAARPQGEWSARLAAVILGSSATLTRLEDGGLALSSGLFVHRLEANGAITTLGAPEAYGPFVPETEGDIAGYEAAPRHGLSISGSAERIFVRKVAPAAVYVWDGRAFVKTTGRSPSTVSTWAASRPLVEGDDADASAPPSDHRWPLHVRLADGRTVWFGTDGTSLDESYIETGGDGGVRVKVPVPADASWHHCRLVESVDPHLYSYCDDYRDTEPAVARLARLEGTEWVDVPLAAKNDERVRPLAIDADGGVWFEGGDRPPRLSRIARDGTIVTIPLAGAAAALSRPSYRVYAMAAARAHEDNFREWSAVVLDPGVTEEMLPAHVMEVVPRRDGDVWIVAYGGPSRAKLLYRIARDDAAHEPRVLRSLIDEQNEVRNTRPLRPWIGHCPQIFVTLASAAKGETLPLERVTERLADLEVTLKKLPRDPEQRPFVAAVRGWLGGRHVAGVLFIRSAPEVTEGPMEAAAASLIERFTTNPASPPTATCTLPVLEEVLRRYP